LKPTALTTCWNRAVVKRLTFMKGRSSEDHGPKRTAADSPTVCLSHSEGEYASSHIPVSITDQLNLEQPPRT
jgi:hypothetical protein